MDCPAPAGCDYAKSLGKGGRPACHARMDFMFVLPEVNMGAVYQLSTGSVNSDIDIRSGLEMTRGLFGHVSWVPLQLRREPMKIADPESGRMNTHWPVKLYLVANIEQVNFLRKDPQRIPEIRKIDALPEPVRGGEPVTTMISTPIDDPPEEEAQASNVMLDILTALNDCRTVSEIDALWESCEESIPKMTESETVGLQTAKEKRLTELRKK
jgi:Recombination directionality factor-like